MFGQIDRGAFTADNTAVSKEITDRIARAQEVNASKVEAIQLLTHQLGRTGVPKDAAVVIATRIVELEYHLAEVQALLRPAHLTAVELRG